MPALGSRAANVMLWTMNRALLTAGIAVDNPPLPAAEVEMSKPGSMQGLQLGEFGDGVLSVAGAAAIIGWAAGAHDRSAPRPRWLRGQRCTNIAAGPAVAASRPSMGRP